jgi:hypothetical protein
VKRSISLPPIVIDRLVPSIDVRSLAQHLGDQWRVMSAHYSDFVPLPDEPPGIVAYEFDHVTVEFFRIYDEGYDYRDIAVHVVTDPANLTPHDDHEGFYDPDKLRCRNPLLAAVIETERAKWLTKPLAALNRMRVEIMGEVAR